MSDSPTPCDYTLGFATSPDGQHVMLIEKNRPSWQAGHLNGIGGHVEPGETPHQAMVRECREESGLDIAQWKPIGKVEFEGGTVHVFHAAADLSAAQSLTDETVRILPIASVMSDQHPLVNDVYACLDTICRDCLPKAAGPSL